MANDVIRDAELLTIADSLGLKALSNRAEYEWLLQSRLSWGTYQRFRELRDANKKITPQSDPESIYAADAAYFSFVAAHPNLCRLHTEGRLSYYDVILPRIVSAIRHVPHARILDLGCYSGITSLYLGRVFPACQVVGIERNANTLSMAESFQRRSGLSNVSFFHGDYHEYRPESPFDVVISLQTVECHFLPSVLSASPESFIRGPNLLAATQEHAGRIMHVMKAFDAMHNQIEDSGRLVLHERIYDLQRALMFHYLLSQANFEMMEAGFVSWHNTYQRNERQSCPFIVASATQRPATFNERLMIESYTLPDGFTDLSDLPSNQIVTWHGLEADANYRSLPGVRNDLTVRIEMRNAIRLHFHLGDIDNRLAYVYACDTADNRKLMVGRIQLMRPLFEGTINDIRGMLANNGIIAIEPQPDELCNWVAQRLSRNET